MGGINGIATARITYGIRVHAASLVLAAQVYAHHGNGGNGSASASNLAAKLVDQEREALREIVCEKCREEGKELVGRCEFEAFRERKQCEECLTAGRENMVELLQDRTGPASFLLSYGLCVVTWPGGNNFDLDIDLHDFTFDDEEEVAADALNPLLPMTLELIPSSSSSSSSSSPPPSPWATFPQLEAWSLADGPTATASAAIDLDKVKELDERAEAFARFLKKSGVSLVDVEEEGKPRMRVELESRVSY